MDRWDERKLDNMKIGWRFPSNDHGKEDGVNDAGIETFLNKPIESLARESIQNSLDARDKSIDKPVEVHFKLSKHPTSIFPLSKEFSNIINSCKKFWSDAKTTEFLNKAFKTINNDEIEVLTISDYNTTGLMGAEQVRNSDWSKLIKSVGSSDKAQGSGGSFGIGKHAPFACSLLRTIFYGTKDIDGKEAFQGKSILVTHTMEGDETTQGTGYFGYKQYNTAIIGYDNLPKIFRREENGTDLFVMGFNKVRDWETRIIKSVLEEFFVAIKSGRLIVRVEDIVINEASLKNIIDRYSQDDPEWLAGKYFNALVSKDTERKSVKDFEGMGEVELYILPGKNYPKRIAMVRATGMKIFDKGRFHTPLKFAGVFIAKGDKINEFLRNCEPPTHDSWIYERYNKDADKAKSVLTKLNKWIHESVRELANKGQVDEADAEGMSQFLPDEFTENNQRDNEDKEGEKGAPVEIQIRTKKKELRNTDGKSDIQEIINIDDAAADSDEGNGTGDEEHEIPTGGGPGEHAGHGGGGGGGETGTGGEDPTGSGKNPPQVKGKNSPAAHKSYKLIEIKGLRAFCSDPDQGIYRIMFEPLKDTEETILQIKVLGDTDDELAPIQSAKVSSTSQELSIISSGRIGKFPMKKKEKITFEVKLACIERCALGVTVYGTEIS